jgi:hypothetical protein
MSAMPASFGNALEGSAVCMAAAMVLAGAVERRTSWLAAGAVLLTVTRPEGVAFAGLAILWSLWAAWRGRLTWRGCWTATLCVGATVVALTAFRLYYYGDFIPNTLRAKSTFFGAPLGPAPLGPAGAYLLDYIQYFGWATFVLALMAPVLSKRRDISLLALAMALLSFAIAYANGGDWMVNYRLLTPYYPAIALAAVMSLHAVWRKKRAWGLILAAGCALLATRPVQWDALEQSARALPMTLRIAQGRFDGEDMRFGSHTRVSNLQRADDKVVVESGGAPAYSLDGVHVIEMNGLTDRQIARINNPYAYKRRGTGTINWLEVFKKEPTYFFFNPLSTFFYLNDIAQVPGLREELDRFILFQASPAAAGMLWYNILLVRDDRDTLPGFLRDYGMAAPVRDFLSPHFAGQYFFPVFDGDTGLWHNERLFTPWQAEPWVSSRGDMPAPAWHDWQGVMRLSTATAIEEGETTFTKTLIDDAPLVFLFGVPGERANGIAVHASYTGPDNAPHEALHATLTPQDESLFTTGVFSAPGPPEGFTTLELTVTATVPLDLFMAVHRWRPGPAPALDFQF